MSKQVALRLSNDLVAYIDEAVAEGRATSRAALVADALDRDRRRQRAERDAAILAAAGADRDLDDLADYAATVPIDDLD